jgi:hypothetical protein
MLMLSVHWMNSLNQTFQTDQLYLLDLLLR